MRSQERGRLNHNVIGRLHRIDATSATDINQTALFTYPQELALVWLHTRSLLCITRRNCHLLHWLSSAGVNKVPMDMWITLQIDLIGLASIILSKSKTRINPGNEMPRQVAICTLRGQSRSCEDNTGTGKNSMATSWLTSQRSHAYQENIKHRLYGKNWPV